MKGSKERLKPEWIFLFILLTAPFLNIAAFKTTLGSVVYNGWKAAAFCGLFFLFLFKGNQVKLNWSIGLFGIYQCVILLSCIVHHKLTYGIIISTFSLLFVFVLLQTDFFETIMTAACCVIIVALTVNFPEMLKKTSEVDVIYFLGGKNALGIFLTPGYFLLIIYSLEKYKKVKCWSVVATCCCLWTIFVGGSGTGVVVSFCGAALLLLALMLKPSKLIYLGGILAAYIVLLFFSEAIFQTRFWAQIAESLGKDATLTSRTRIWNKSFELLKNNWLFGTGRGTEISYINVWGEEKSVVETHNSVLQILLDGGVISLLLYGILFAKAVCRLNFEKAEQRVVFIALCVTLVNGLTESIANHFFVMMLLGVACRYAEEERTKKCWKKAMYDDCIQQGLTFRNKKIKANANKP